METELQTLQREIDELRNENIALYNELTKQNKILCEEILNLRKELYDRTEFLHQAIRFFNSQNLRVYLVHSAGMQTAEFIAENMNKVRAFDNKKDYLKYVVNQSNVLGEYLEFGVYKGETINIISETKPDKIIYGFDSFEGLPEDWRYDWRYDFMKGSFALNGNLPRVNENVRLVKGWFNETLPEFVKVHPEPCAFIHVDCDLYSSTKTIFDNLKDKIISGTVIAFDEYFNYPGWQQDEYKAFMELVTEKNFEFEYIARTDFEQVAVKIK